MATLRTSVRLGLAPFYTEGPVDKEYKILNQRLPVAHPIQKLFGEAMSELKRVAKFHGIIWERLLALKHINKFECQVIAFSPQKLIVEIH